jgi:hypothetical protein
MAKGSVMSFRPSKKFVLLLKQCMSTSLKVVHTAHMPERSMHVMSWYPFANWYSADCQQKTDYRGGERLDSALFLFNSGTKLELNLDLASDPPR